jgi:alginate export protein
MKKLLILFLVLFLCTPAVAADWTDNLTIGGDVRMRGYKLHNFFDFNDDSEIDNWNVFRLRTRLYAKANLGDNISGFVRLANQTYGENVDPAEDVQKEADFGPFGVQFDAYNADNKSNKVFVDNAYITVKDFFGTGTTFNAGRMNLMYGSGFVVFDGQSQMASTSIYFDGVKLSIPLGENAVVDALYFKDQENMRWETDPDDVTLTGAYLTAKCPVMGGKQELYFLSKNDEKIEKDIYMTGLRLSNKFDFGLDYSAEFAYQFGQFDDAADIDQDSMGYKLDAGFTLKDAPMTPRIFCGYVFMEGDDPDTDDQERWDHFYGGWPQFGDLLAWKYVSTGYNSSLGGYDSKWREQSTTVEEAVYSNLTILQAGIGCNLTKSLSAKFTYAMLNFDEPIIDAAGNKKDDDFGDYYQLQAKYTYSKNLSFAMYAALIEPGDAFEVNMNPDAPSWTHVGDDDAYEFFWEANLSF